MIRDPSMSSVASRTDAQERAELSQRRSMTRAEVLDEIRRPIDLYGEPPTMADWDPYRAWRIGQAWRIRRNAEGDWPTTQTVGNKFGRLSDVVAAVGFVPRRQGQQRPGVRSALDEDLKRHLGRVRALPAESTGPDQLANALRQVALARPLSESGDLRGTLVERCRRGPGLGIREAGGHDRALRPCPLRAHGDHPARHIYIL
jgi:hypothetical protein